jgi:hypothetical protein
MVLDSLPFIPARDFKKGRAYGIRIIVIHDAECAETPTAAEDLGNYGKHPDYPSSWHISCDSDSCERSVRDEDTAYAAPPLNAVALHIELAGKGAQTREQWLDAYSSAVLDNAAGLVAQWCKRHSIPVVHLTNQQLEQGMKGIVGHYQVSAVYKKSDHTDPGVNFPWDAFMHRVALMAAQCP